MPKALAESVLCGTETTPELNAEHGRESVLPVSILRKTFLDLC